MTQLSTSVIISLHSSFPLHLSIARKPRHDALPSGCVDKSILGGRATTDLAEAK